MSDLDPRLMAAMRRQLDARPAGAQRVGWKVGFGDGERIGAEIAVGTLTSATTLESGSTYRGGGSDLHAEAELAVEIGAGCAIVGYAAAIELVDLDGGQRPEDVVADNVYHRAVAFGNFTDTCPERLEGALVVNGERRAVRAMAFDVAERLSAVNCVLAAVGERLAPGDRVITGLIVQVPVEPDDEVSVVLGGLGRVALRIA